jgi:hypothetical protein
MKKVYHYLESVLVLHQPLLFAAGASAGNEGGGKSAAEDAGEFV